jgi:broad specificity phosphatase PhoE
VKPLVRQLELRRHTDNDGDALTETGIRDAEQLGMQLRPNYALFASTGAHRATQMAEILRRAVGADAVPILIVEELRSSVEDRWREAARLAGKGADLEAIRRIDPQLVERETQLLGTALRQLLNRVPAGGRGLFIGHSPTIEAAVLGLTGQLVPPLAKGAGLLVTDAGGVQPLN